jgi:hypothetical protein
VAGCFSLAAFFVAILAGLAADNPATLILGRAVLAMALCYPVGVVIGLICQHAVEERRGTPPAEPGPAESLDHPIESAGDEDQEAVAA